MSTGKEETIQESQTHQQQQQLNKQTAQQQLHQQSQVIIMEKISQQQQQKQQQQEQNIAAINDQQTAGKDNTEIGEKQQFVVIQDQQPQIQTEFKQTQQQQQQQLKPTNIQQQQPPQQQSKQTQKKKKSTITKQSTNKKSKQDKILNSKQKQQLMQLQLLLKQKLKEIKTLSSKNAKLQAKYIDLFKQNKSVKKDYHILVQTLGHMISSLKQKYNQQKSHNNTQIDQNYLIKSIHTLQQLAKHTNLNHHEMIEKWKQCMSIKIELQLEMKEKEYVKEMDKVKKEQVEKAEKDKNEMMSKWKQQVQSVRSLLQQKQDELSHTIAASHHQLSTHTQQLSTLTSTYQQQLTSLKQTHQHQLSTLKHSLKQQLLQSSSNQLQQLSTIHQQQLKSLYQEIEQLKNKQIEYIKTIKQMDVKIDNKNAQLSKVMKEKLKLEHQLNQIKVKAIQEEFEETENYEKNQQQFINQRNQFLKTRQELQIMIDKKEQMRTQVVKIQNQLKTKNLLLDKKNQQIEELIGQLNAFQKGKSEGKSANKNIKVNSNIMQQQCSKQHQHEQQLVEIKSQSAESLPSLNQPKPLDQTNQNQKQQYLRNVFIRYIKALVKGESSSTLLRVILTILKVDEKDKLEVQQLFQNSKKKWWIF